MKKNAEETFNLRSKLKIIAYLTMNILLTRDSSNVSYFCVSNYP